MANRLEVDIGALHQVGMAEARREVTTTTRRTFNRSQVLCPVDTGNLRASGSMSVRPTATGWLGTVTYDADYAMAVHNGRRALTIRAKGGGMLKFVVDGRTVYARSVRQPVRAGRPFLSTALAEVAVGQGFRVVTFG